jgi:hypothetical protein
VLEKLNLPTSVNLFNLYVALSMSSGRETTSLLQDFNGQLFTQGHDPMLLVKDDRLEDFEKTNNEMVERMCSSTEMDLRVPTQ